MKKRKAQKEVECDDEFKPKHAKKKEHLALEKPQAVKNAPMNPFDRPAPPIMKYDKDLPTTPESTTGSSSLQSSRVRPPKRKPLESDDDTKRREEINSRTCFIGNLPPAAFPSHVLRSKLSHIFVSVLDDLPANVESVRIRGGVGTDANRPFRVSLTQKDALNSNAVSLIAFVRLASAELMQRACKLIHGTIHFGRHLRVGPLDVVSGKPIDPSCAASKSSAEDAKTSAVGHSEETSVFVGNLGFKVSDEQVWSHFEEKVLPQIQKKLSDNNDEAKVVNVRVIRDRKTGAGKGFGYIDFGSKKVARLVFEAFRDTTQSPRNVNSGLPRRQPDASSDTSIHHVEERRLRIEKCTKLDLASAKKQETPKWQTPALSTVGPTTNHSATSTSFPPSKRPKTARQLEKKQKRRDKRAAQAAGVQ